MTEPAIAPRGVPKSGRFWKEQKTRFSTVKKSPGLKKSFRDKQIFREDLKKTKAMSRELIQQRNAEKEAAKQRRRDNIMRRKENLLKSEVLQVVKNPAKLKRMKKKELKNIEKRDTLNMKK